MHPVSDAQLQANRENAAHSTGPVTPAGKEIVRHNALKHGFAGQTLVIPEHEQAAFLQHLENFRAEYQPKGVTEEVLVQSMADVSWSAQQIAAHSLNFLSTPYPSNIPSSGNAQTDYAILQSQHAAAQIKSLNTLGIYEQRKTRLFHATRRELAQVQAERKAKEKAELEQAAQLRKLCKLHRDPAVPEWHPSENGFVCSLEEIDRYIAAQDRFSRLVDPKKMAA
jgi:hypothetical protein